MQGPLRQRHTGATTRGYTERVKPCADKHIFAFRRLAENKIAIRGKTLGTVQHLLDTGIGECREIGRAHV
jgi:hypothetical protein